MDLFKGLSREEIQQMVEDVRDPKYWEKEAARERERNKEWEQKYIDVTLDCDALQKRVHRLEAALADLYMEYKGAERQWQVDWDKQGEHGLMTSLLNGEDVVVPGTGPVRQLYDLLARLNLLESSECVQYSGGVYRPWSYQDKDGSIRYIWYDAEEHGDNGAENVPHHLYVLLSGRLSNSTDYLIYATRHQAIEALKVAIAKFRGE